MGTVLIVDNDKSSPKNPRPPINFWGCYVLPPVLSADPTFVANGLADFSKLGHVFPDWGLRDILVSN